MPVLDSHSSSFHSTSTNSKPPIGISDTLVAVNISEAISSDNLDRLQTVLREMNTTMAQFNSPFGNLLHITASFGSIGLLKKLIEQSGLNVNAQTDQGSTPLHVAARQNRIEVVEFLMGLEEIDDTIRDLEGRTPLECAKSRQVRNVIEYMRSIHIARVMKEMHQLVKNENVVGFKALFSGNSKRNLYLIDVNSPNSRGESILHEAARRDNLELVQACLNIGADPFQKNRKGKIPLELTKKDSIKSILKTAPMIKSKQLLGSKTERVEGFLNKWTNYAGGYRRRWFVLEDGILSYFASPSDYPATCRGSINLEFFKITPHKNDLCKFELIGVRSANIKYFLKADNQDEAKRWIFCLAQAQTNGHSQFIHESRSNTNLFQLINEPKEGGMILSPTAPTTPSIDHLFNELLKQEVEISAFFDMLLDLSHEKKEQALSIGLVTDAHSLFLKSIRGIREQLLRLEAFVAQKDRRLLALKNEKQILEDAVRALAIENNRMQERLRSLPDDSVSDDLTLVELDQSIRSPPEISQYDSEDEFYDAYDESILIDSMTDLSLKAHHVPATVSAAPFDAKALGYPSKPRSALPADSTKMPAISLWNILKNAIQQPDITKMPIPINFSEPISMLQRMCEDMEYADLLETAAKTEDPIKRLLYISAFAVSAYSSTDGRVKKPFNPLLGETFEFVHPEGKFRYLAEQVSHHPPIGAAYCEAPGFVYWNEVHLSSKFCGKYLELRPEGMTHLRLNDIHYSWKRVNTAVHNIIVGKLYIEHYGSMTIKQHNSDWCAEIQFLPSGWRRNNCNRIQGVIKNVQSGTVAYNFSGLWNSELWASEGESGEKFLIWKRNEFPPIAAQSYNMTAFAMTLNEMPESLGKLVCPSDSRLRPDQRAMEEGSFNEASQLKVQLEEKQRKARKLMESGPDFVYEPRWFRRALEPETEAPHWIYVGGYWESRQQRKWERIPQIYL